MKKKAIKPFTTLEEVDSYLSGDEVTCLECGQHFKALGKHLMPAHDMSTRSYREKYNIPRTRSLSGQSLIELRSKNRKELLKSRPDISEALLNNQKRSTGGYKGTSPVIHNMVSRYGTEKSKEHQYNKNKMLFKPVIEHLTAGLSIKDILKIDGMPNDSGFFSSWRKRYPEFEKMLQHAAKDMSLSQKLRLRISSEKEMIQLIRPMIEKGCTQKEISNKLLISSPIVKFYVDKIKGGHETSEL